MTNRRGSRTRNESAETALEQVTREARESIAGMRMPAVDWSRVESSLFARVEAEAKAEAEKTARARGPATDRAPRRLWAPLAVGFAVAAAASAIFVVRGESTRREGTPFDNLSTSTAPSPRSAGSLAAVDGEGNVLASGRVLHDGDSIALGDKLETHGTRATFRRFNQPRDETPAVTFALERDTTATVTHVAGALVLTLEDGAIEAQVTPVPNGEAFAIDVRATRGETSGETSGDALPGSVTRVAVHGTHLRVARIHGRVVVDLSEGVVSVGAPPRVGSTYGELVTAPAHLSFVPGDVAASLAVDHAAASVRVPLSLATLSSGEREPLAPSSPAAAPLASARAVGAPLAAAPFSAGDTTPPLPMRMEEAEAGDTRTPSTMPSLAAPDPNAEATIAQAVRACLAARPPSPDVATMRVRSVLDLRVGDDGFVQLARFTPPLAPAVQTCASATIYKTRFAHAGTPSVAIDYRSQ